MALPRRMWCSCTIIDYLKGTPRAQPCEEIIMHAAQGEIEIVVSMLAQAEVAHLGGTATDEARIKEFFGRRYVISVLVDRTVAERARELVRQYGLRPLDAVHGATALLYRIPILETFDADFDVLKGLGQPPLTVQEPVWLGQTTLLPPNP